MNRLCAAIAVLLVAFGCATSGDDAGWITLLDGTAKSLDNFNRTGDANWRVEDGAVVADKGKGGLLVSKNSYRDFQIRAEFWADHTTNSGIYIRATDPKKISSATAYEVNIYDQRPDPSCGTGAIVNVAKVAPMPKAGGRWNTFLITAEGPRLLVDLNGQRTAGRHRQQVPERAVRASVRQRPERCSRRRHQVAQGADQAAVAAGERSGRKMGSDPIFQARCASYSALVPDSLITLAHLARSDLM